MLVHKREQSVTAITLTDVTESEQDAQQRVQEMLIKYVAVVG
jgi:hypothetical protein